MLVAFRLRFGLEEVDLAEEETTIGRDPSCSVSIDDDLLRRARSAAASEGRTLSEIVTEALRERFARGAVATEQPYRPVTFGKRGPLAGVDITNNAAVRDLLDES